MRPARTVKLYLRSHWDWPAYIAALPAHIQVAVARIVWWDYFSGRISADRWADLDWWLNQPMPEDENLEETISGLVAVGYTSHRARSRVMHAKKTAPYLKDSAA